MQAIKAIYDGNEFKPMEPIPVKGKCEVTIIFPDLEKAPYFSEIYEAKISSEILQQLNPNELTHEYYKKCFSTWDEATMKLVDEIIKEKINYLIELNIDSQTENRISGSVSEINNYISIEVNDINENSEPIFKPKFNKEEQRKRILRNFAIIDAEDVKTIEEMVNCRTKGRVEL